MAILELYYPHTISYYKREARSLTEAGFLFLMNQTIQKASPIGF